MDFKKIISRQINNLFEQTNTNPNPNNPSSANQNKKSINNLIAAGAAGAAGAGVGSAIGGAALMRKSNTQANVQKPSETVSSAVSKAGDAAANVQKPSETVSSAMSRAGEQVQSVAPAIKTAAKSAVTHAADFVAQNPGVALGTAAAGTAAWLAKRRALKKMRTM